MDHRTRPQGSATTEEVSTAEVAAPAVSAERHRPRGLRRRFAGERGAATAEYAVATMAAVGFAGLLVVINRASPTNLCLPSSDDLIVPARTVPREWGTESACAIRIGCEDERRAGHLRTRG